MILRWEPGRSSVDALLARGQLTRVAPNREHAERMLQQARAHLASAATIAETDPTGAFVLAYDGARKAPASILVNQGLRAGGDGAHAVLLAAARSGCSSPSIRSVKPSSSSPATRPENWNRWYRQAIPIADERYTEHLIDLKEDES